MGARTIEVPKRTCEIPQAVVRSGLYLCHQPFDPGTGFGLLPTWVGLSSSGDSISQGKTIEPAREINENKTKAREPFRAMSPTTSVEDFSSAALFSS